MPRPRKNSEDATTQHSLPTYRVAVGGEIGAAANDYATAEDMSLTDLVKTALKHYLRNVADPPFWPRSPKA